MHIIKIEQLEFICFNFLRLIQNCLNQRFLKTNAPGGSSSISYIKKVNICCLILGPRQTRYFHTQYCNTEITRYCNKKDKKKFFVQNLFLCMNKQFFQGKNILILKCNNNILTLKISFYRNVFYCHIVGKYVWCDEGLKMNFS